MLSAAPFRLSDGRGIPAPAPPAPGGSVGLALIPIPTRFAVTAAPSPGLALALDILLTYSVAIIVRLNNRTLGLRRCRQVPEALRSYFWMTP